MKRESKDGEPLRSHVYRTLWITQQMQAVLHQFNLGHTPRSPRQELLKMTDAVTAIRREMQRENNADLSPREELEKQYGQTWDTDQMQEDFEVLGFAAPFVVVRRRSDRVKGSLQFRHSPRIYFSFKEHKE